MLVASRRGSSPRVRGSLLCAFKKPVTPGIIPAGAGLTDASLLPESTFWDHPRGCGAHSTTEEAKPLELGSSPRVRGSLEGNHFRDRVYGIIPAGAGLTLSMVSHGTARRDHPRGCGAHILDRVEDLGNEGSSPRVRGSQERDASDKITRGIIPAGAGLTCRSRWIRRGIRDHPRGCGAHTHSLRATSAGQGSSPRVRGSHDG